jgi:hypothetical protein
VSRTITLAGSGSGGVDDGDAFSAAFLYPTAAAAAIDVVTVGR